MRLSNIVKKIASGEAIEERRGGDRKSHLSVRKKNKQIQQLPKSNIQDAYYLRQFNFYSLCITSLDGVNPTFYTWTEELGGKGSTEISFALYSHLSKMNLEGADWKLLDTKSLSVYFRNFPYISEVKRLVLQKEKAHVKVKGFKNFRFEEQNEQSGVVLLKKGISVAVVKRHVLQTLPLSHPITLQKKDVEKLLKLMYGEEWQNQPDDIFNWYKHIIYDMPASTEEVEEVECDCLDEDIGLRV
ncbi:hypothetical protein J6590_090370 [Homalodisca vitripennis]|nr:hypothetical protein J6590_090370 [Homalodisca vitripennis]